MSRVFRECNIKTNLFKDSFRIFHIYLPLSMFEQSFNKVLYPCKCWEIFHSHVLSHISQKLLCFHPDTVSPTSFVGLALWRYLHQICFNILCLDAWQYVLRNYWWVWRQPIPLGESLWQISRWKQSLGVIRLMEKILHHLWCPKRFFYGAKKLFSGIVSGAGFFPSTVSSKNNLFPTTFWKMSRPKARKYFGRYHLKHCSCFENTFWGGCLKICSRNIGGQMSPTFPWRILWEIPPMVSKELTNRSLAFLEKYLPRKYFG